MLGTNSTSTPTIAGATTNSAVASTLAASSSHHTTTSLGAIVGGVTGSAILIIIIIIIIITLLLPCLRRRRRRRELVPRSPSWVSPFSSPHTANGYSERESNSLASTPRTDSLAQLPDQASQSGRKTTPPSGEAVAPRARIVHEDSGRRFRPHEWIISMEEIPPDYSPD